MLNGTNCSWIQQLIAYFLIQWKFTGYVNYLYNTGRPGLGNVNAVRRPRCMEHYLWHLRRCEQKIEECFIKGQLAQFSFSKGGLDMKKRHWKDTYSRNCPGGIFLPVRCHFFSSTLIADYDHILHSNMLYFFIFVTLIFVMKYSMRWWLHIGRTKMTAPRF